MRQAKGREIRKLMRLAKMAGATYEDRPKKALPDGNTECWQYQGLVSRNPGRWVCIKEGIVLQSPEYRQFCR